MLRKVPILGIFLSTLSLRRATLTDDVSSGGKIISIHALLAESDVTLDCLRVMRELFLSTLSLRRATRVEPFHATARFYFYPRSPCGERLISADVSYSIIVFLSTLSLRRATREGTSIKPILCNFYPRSPCGERRRLRILSICITLISIHALLAESDVGLSYFYIIKITISIHALLAESDHQYQLSCK